MSGGNMSLYTTVQLLGGIGIFLYAIKLISESLQILAGDRLRSIIGMFTRTPIIGVFLGTAVTMIIQSSSATTVMTVSFVDAGLMSLTQAIGVIMGANIGTTITGQILAFRVKDLAYLFVLIGVALMFACSSKKYKHIGEGLLGFGLLFIGMQTMESSMSFLRTRQDIFISFSNNPLLGLAAGTLLTLLVQSSSATVGLTIALGTQGLLPLEAAIPIILGDNIGTTITAVLAALGTGKTARQACAAHVLFNILGVCIWLPLMPLWIGYIAASSSSIGHQIANAHTLFNICNTLLFLPFVKPFANVIRRIIPDADRIDRRDAVYLDPILIQRTPVVAVSAVCHECREMGRKVLELFKHTENVFFKQHEEEIEEVIKLEDTLDRLEISIRNYASDIIQAGIDGKDADFLAACVVCAGDLERIGDKCKRIIDFYEYRKKRSDDFSQNAMEEIRSIFEETYQVLQMSVAVFDDASFTETERGALDMLADHIRETESALRARHVARLCERKCSPESGLVFIDVLGAIEQIAYRSRKIVDHMTEKQPH